MPEGTERVWNALNAVLTDMLADNYQDADGRDFVEDAKAFVAEIDSHALAVAFAKINRNDPRSGWRKFQPQYQSLLTVDAHYLKQYWERRVRFYSLMSPELIERFSHLIARHDD